MKSKKPENTVTIEQTPDTKKSGGNLSIVSLLKKMSEDSGFMKNSLIDISNAGSSISESMLNTVDILKSLSLNYTALRENSSIVKKSGKTIKSASLDIEPYLKNIVDLLKYISGKKLKKGQKPTASEKIDTSNLNNLSVSLSGLGDVISRKTNRNLRTFNKLIKELSAQTPQIENTIDTLKPLADSFKTVGNAAREVTSSIKAAFNGILLFSIFLQSPLFLKATSSLTNFFAALNGRKKNIQKTKITDYKYLFFSIALGITAIVGSLILLKTVDWKTTVALVAFIFAIAAAMNFSTKNKTSISISKNIKKSNNNNLAIAMMSFAAGMGILVLSIYAIKDLNWKQAGMLIIFLVAISAIFVASRFLIGKQAGGEPTGMLGFAFGMGVLILAIAAGEELFMGTDGSDLRVGPWAVAGFVTLMAVILSKGKGTGAARSMLKFAGGVAILVLTIWAWNKIATPGLIKNAFILAGITALFAIILRIAAGDGNFITDLLRKKLKIKTSAKRVSKAVFDKGKIMTYTGCILALALGGAAVIAILSASNVGAEDLIVRALVMVGVLYLIGNYIEHIDLRKLAKVANKKLWLFLGAVSAVAIAGAGMIYILGLTDAPWQDIIIRAGVMIATLGIISLGILAFMKLKFSLKDLVLSTLVMGVIVGIMYISIQAITPLFEAKVEGDLWEKAQVMWATMGVIGAGMIAFGALLMIPAMPIIMAMGAAAMAVIGAVTLLASQAMFVMGEAKISKKHTEAFVESMLIVVDGFTKIKWRHIPKLAASGMSLMPVMKTANLAANALSQLASVEGVNPDDMKRFGDTLNQFMKEFTDNLTNKSAEGLKSAEDANKGIMAMISAAVGFVDVLVKLQSNQVPVYGIENGQQVIKEYRKLDLDNIGADVGNKIGSILTGFIESIKSISINKKLWDSNDQESNLKRVVEIFSGKDGQGGLEGVLSSITSLFSSNESLAILTDPDKSAQLTGLGTTIGEIVSNFINGIKSVEFTDEDKKKIEYTSSIFSGKDGKGGLKEIIKSIEELSKNNIGNSENLAKISAPLINFVKTLKTSFKDAGFDENFGTTNNHSPINNFQMFLDKLNKTNWNGISSGMAKTTVSVDKLVKSINNLKLKNAVELRNTIGAFSNISKLKNLEKMLDKILSMIREINSSQQITQTLTQEQVTVVKSSEETAKETKELIKKSSGTRFTEKYFSENVMGKIDSMMEDLTYIQKQLKQGRTKVFVDNGDSNPILVKVNR